VFLSKDGKEILLAIGSDRQFQNLCATLGIGPIGMDPKFNTNGARVANRLELDSILQSRIGLVNANELMVKIHQLKIPAGLIQNVEEALKMKESIELTIERDGMKGISSFVGKSVYGWRNKSSSMLLPPKLGEHNGELVR
jgi:crotonobetainyl-CoA:carnitine CoA-transferase CaiB-like acyl-CoA transferase